MNILNMNSVIFFKITQKICRPLLRASQQFQSCKYNQNYNYFPKKNIYTGFALSFKKYFVIRETFCNQSETVKSNIPQIVKLPYFKMLFSYLGYNAQSILFFFVNTRQREIFRRREHN